MSQVSRKFDPLRSNYCVLARIVRNNLGFYCCELINHRKVFMYIFQGLTNSNNKIAKPAQSSPERNS